MNELHVRALGGDRYVVDVRGHEVVLDQPVEDGGTDVGPAPVEVFVASLAGCVAFYAGRFLARHKTCAEGLRVDAEWQMSEDRPARVSAITIGITPPPDLAADRLPALLAVARACTVHNSLTTAPEVDIAMAGTLVPDAADLRRCG